MLICQKHESHCVWFAGTSQKQKEPTFILAAGKLPVKVSLVSLNRHLRLHPPEASQSAPLGLSGNKKGSCLIALLRGNGFSYPSLNWQVIDHHLTQYKALFFICSFFNWAKCLLCFPTASDLCWREQILAAWNITHFSDGFRLPYALVQQQFWLMAVTAKHLFFFYLSYSFLEICLWA